MEPLSILARDHAEAGIGTPGAIIAVTIIILAILIAWLLS